MTKGKKHEGWIKYNHSARNAEQKAFLLQLRRQALRKSKHKKGLPKRQGLEKIQ